VAKVESRNFKARYLRLNPNEQRRVDMVIALLESGEYHPLLRWHRLRGEWAGHQSVSVGGDLRIVYGKIEGVICLIALGTHAELHGE